MNAGNLLKLFADIIDLLEAKGIIMANGEFDGSKLDTVKEDVDFAAEVQAVLKNHGLSTPNAVDKILKILPVIASFLDS